MYYVWFDVGLLASARYTVFGRAEPLSFGVLF